MKYGFIAMVILVFASCSPFYFGSDGYEVLGEPLDVAWKKASQLVYSKDSTINDEWKNPYTTERDGGGDCEDIATYLIYLLGPDASAVIITNEGERHCLVEYHGLYIEPQIYHYYYERKRIQIIVVIPYHAVMVLACH